MKNCFNPSNLKWSNYFMKSGKDFTVFWDQYLKEKRRTILFILGEGFDPRMCFGLKIITDSSAPKICDCLSIKSKEGPNFRAKKHEKSLKQNTIEFESLLKKCNNHYPKEIAKWSPDKRPKGDIEAKEIIKNISDLSKYSDIIVDISALPKIIYFPIIAKILTLIEEAKQSGSSTGVPTFHIFVSENVNYDRGIKEQILNCDPFFMRGFISNLESEALEHLPKIWIPILGENKEEHLNKIHKIIAPDEVWPVLPSSSIDPRRSDKLLLMYREFFFDKLNIEPRNIIFASEQNPFDLYRQIHRVFHYKNEALKPLGGFKIIISPLSSKLLSIGALLAAYELKQKNVGIIHIEPQDYIIDESIETVTPNLFSLLLVGN